MKKLFFSIIFLFSCLISFSQNWDIAQINKNYFFDLDPKQTNQGMLDAFAGFKVDSSYAITGDTFYIHSKKLSPSPIGFIACDTVVESYFGVKTIKKTNSTKIINLNNDTFYFPKLHPQLNDWKLIEFTNGAYINAHIIHSDTITFKQNLDSIIQIRLTKRDTSNARIGSIDDTISILKDNGWHKTLNWTHFPDTNKTFHYRRSEFELMTKYEIYDFDINDEFHISIRENNGPDDYLNIKIISKSIYSDSVTYTREIDRESNVYDGSIWPPVRTYYSHYTDTITYSNINQLTGSLPSNFDSDSIYIHTINNMTRNQTNRKGYTVTKPRYHYKNGNKFCYSSASTERTFIKGCGSLDYKSDFVNGSQNYTLEQLMYYKKDTITWGTPYLITSLTAKESHENRFKVFPNPAKNNIQIESIKQTKYVRLFDLNGRILKDIQVRQSSNLSIDVSDINNGLYIIELEQVDGMILNDKFIIKR